MSSTQHNGLKLVVASLAGVLIGGVLLLGGMMATRNGSTIPASCLENKQIGLPVQLGAIRSIDNVGNYLRIILQQEDGNYVIATIDPCSNQLKSTTVIVRNPPSPPPATLPE